MPAQTRLFPCRSDNYGVLLHDPETGATAAIDAPEAAPIEAALKATGDAAWTENWKLSFQGKTIFAGQRFLAYREMFLNHLVHHRAQLGVYLRLNDIPLPATYGPSADDRMGF